MLNIYIAISAKIFLVMKLFSKVNGKALLSTWFYLSLTFYEVNGADIIPTEWNRRLYED